MIPKDRLIMYSDLVNTHLAELIETHKRMNVPLSDLERMFTGLYDLLPITIQADIPYSLKLMQTLTTYYAIELKRNGTTKDNI